FGGVTNDVLESLHIITGVQQVRVLVVDLLDATGGNFVVEAFNLEADFLQVVDDVIANRNRLVIGRNREIPIINADLVAAVGAAVHHGFLAGAPPSLIGIHVVERVIDT